MKCLSQVFYFFSKSNLFLTEVVTKALCIGPQQGPSTLPCTLLLELQIYKDTTRCATMGIYAFLIDIITPPAKVRSATVELLCV